MRIKALARFLANFTNNRPLAFLSALGGLRDFFMGLGFVLGLSQIQQTHLYQNYNALIPHFSGPAAGWLLIVIGLVVVVSALMNKTRWVQKGLRASALIWLFSTIMYGLNGDLVLASIFGIFFSIPAGYLAYYYRFSPRWTEQKQMFREEWLKLHNVSQEALNELKDGLTDR